MIKKFFKKHNKKIIAFIGVLTTTICGVLGITKTYAYETDKMSYTITQIGSTNNNYQSITDNTNYIDISYDNENRLYFKNNNGFSFKQYYILINFAFLDDNSQPVIRNISNRVSLTPSYVNITNNNRQAQSVYANTSTYNYNTTNEYYTICLPMVFTTIWGETMNYIYITNWFYLGSVNGSSLSSYDYRIYNIDLVTSEDLGLSQYYETYYSNIENQYQQLLNDYNELQDNYNELLDNYDTLENEYDTLENNYNDLNGNYTDLINSARGGIFNYVSYLSSYGDHTMEFTKQQLIDNGTINGSTFDYGVLYDLYPDLTSNGNYLGYLNFSFSTPINLNILNLYIETNMNCDIFIDLVKITDSGILNPNVRYGLSIPYSKLVEWNYVINFDNLNSIMVGTVLENFNAFTRITFNDTLGVYFTDNSYYRITSINTPYQIGYQNGYNEGFNYGRSSQQSTINTLTEDITDLNQQITDMQLIINDLNDQIGGFSDDYNLNNLIWTIGGTPFESFKHIWNVNFFGVNVADFILGFITTFLGLFIFKKFFF